MRKFLKHTISIIFCLVLSFSFSHSTFAKSKSSSSSSAQNFYFTDFTADYYLKKASDGTGSLHVKEVLTAVFPNSNQNHGIERKIPFTNQNGKNITIDSKSDLNLTVLRDGKPEKFTLSIDESEKMFVARIGDASTYVHGPQTYTLEYDFKHVITAFDKSDYRNTPYQELYWDTNGTGWSQHFSEVTANLHIEDPEVLKALDKTSWCYRGTEGSNTSCANSTRTADGFTWSASGLSAHENLTFVVNFDDDTFKIVEPPKNYVYCVLAVLLSFLTALFIWVYYKKSYLKAKDKIAYFKNKPVPPQYQPPKDYTVGELANISFKNYRGDVMVSTMLELITSKKVDIIKDDEKGKKWSIKINSLEVNPWELDVLKIITKDADPKVDQIYKITRKYSSTNYLFARDFLSTITTSLQTKQAFEPQKHSKITVTTSGNSKGADVILAISLLIMLSVFLFGFGSAAAEVIVGIADLTFTINGGQIVYYITVIASTLILTFLAVKAFKNSQFNKRTEKGLDLANYAEGLELYIKMAEADRIKFLQSVQGADTSNSGVVKLYEKLLPYAALFGLEKSWMKTLEQYYSVEGTTTPDWYAAGFTYASLHSVTSSIRSGTSGSSSSSSSGGGGGGHSGGGGGGGGGGGW